VTAEYSQCISTAARERNFKTRSARTSKLVPLFFSDEWKSYEGLTDNYDHAVINHAVEYVSGNVHTNTIENFWSLLKRGLHGTYVSVEPFHLFRYIDEQVFRYNNRKELDDHGRFELAISQIVGKRLTYKALTGKVEDPTTPF